MGDGILTLIFMESFTIYTLTPTGEKLPLLWERVGVRAKSGT
jgi:hypothetical protein